MTGHRWLGEGDTMNEHSGLTGDERDVAGPGPVRSRPAAGIRAAADARSRGMAGANQAGARDTPPEAGETARLTSDRLPGWREGASKQAILEFVQRVTTEGSPDFVPPPERVAVFDNDGTLWCEKPMPIQLDFILRRLAAMAEQDQSLRTRQPWRAAYTRDYGWLGQVITKHYHGDDSDLPVLAAGVLQAFAGITVEDFEAQADAFLRSAQHPTLGRAYLACSYTPMVELLGDLETNGFRNYIASGGGRDFMRPISQEVYGVPRQRVIGSSVSLAYQEDGGGGTIVRRPEADVLDDGPEKPVRIWSRVGRRPLLAAGNSNGDIPMLAFAEQPGRPSLRLLVLHDDPAREFDYTAGAEQALQLASTRGWNVVSIKDDWATVF
jgi:phosphoserine phosphatase